MTYCVKIAILLLKNKRKDGGLMWIKNVRLIGALAEVSAVVPAAVWLDGEKV